MKTFEELGVSAEIRQAIEEMGNVCYKLYYAKIKKQSDTFAISDCFFQIKMFILFECVLFQAVAFQCETVEV